MLPQQRYSSIPQPGFPPSQPQNIFRAQDSQFPGMTQQPQQTQPMPFSVQAAAQNPAPQSILGGNPAYRQNISNGKPYPNSSFFDQASFLSTSLPTTFGGPSSGTAALPTSIAAHPLSGLSSIKQESALDHHAHPTFVDPTDPFAIPTDFQQDSVLDAQTARSNQNILSPASSSPLHTPEYEAHDDFLSHPNQRSSSALYDSPQVGGSFVSASSSIPKHGFFSKGDQMFPSMGGFSGAGSANPIDVKSSRAFSSSAHTGHGQFSINPGSNIYSMSVPVGPNATFSATMPQSIPDHHSSYPYSTSLGGYTDAGSLDDPDSKQYGNSIDLMQEKRRRRRESHNAVERRRRDNINEKIQELATLLPDFASDPQNKPNKGVILRKSVEYIRQVNILAQKQSDRVRELEDALRKLLAETGAQERDLGLSLPLGTTLDLATIISSMPQPSVSYTASSAMDAMMD